MLSSMMPRFLRYLVFVAVLGCVAASAHAQNAELTGAVLDPQGLAIPGATITVINNNTQVRRTTISTSSGNYDVPALNPGSYSIRAQKDGFETIERSGITLFVATVSRLDLRLAVGSQQQSVVVNGDASHLQTDDATISQIIENKDIVALPLNGRTYTQLAVLAPGIAMSGAVSLPVYSNPPYESPSLATTGGFIAVSGSRADANEFTLDGISTDASMDGGTFAFPPIDSIQEFKLLQSNYGAEYGYHTGQVVLTTKTGTNTFHGSAYEFIRNDALDAANFFALTGKNPLKQNQYGASIGGPVLLPGYSGRDRTFFFVNYEGARIRAGSTSTSTVPTATMRQGDFSQLTKPIVDPKTGLPFAGNVIPADRISPIALNIINQTQYPLPNLTGLANNYNLSPTSSTNLDEVLARVDYNVSQADHLSGTVYWFTRPTYTPRFTMISPTAETVPVQDYSIQETHIFSPALVNDLRLGWNRVDDRHLDGSPKNITQADLGFPQNANQPSVPGVPEFDITGYGSTGASDLSQETAVQHYEIGDTLSWLKKSHMFKFGADFIRQLDFSTDGNWGHGLYSFSGEYSGNGFADFLLCLPASATRLNLPPGVSTHYNHFELGHFAAFAQDDWHITPQLAINLGLRYEKHLPLIEQNNQIANYIQGELNGAPAIVEIVAPDPKYGRCLCIPANLDFAPRIGIAYQLDQAHKTVVRAGYGIAYSYPMLQPAYDLLGNPPYFPKQAVTNVVGNPIFDLANTFVPAALAAGTGNYANSLNRLDGRVQQWTLGAQRDFGYAIVLDVSYLGSTSDQLDALQPLNPALPGPGPFPARRPLPNSPMIPTSFTKNGEANYQAGTVRLSRQFSKGLTFTTHFTWAKSLDDASSPADSGQNTAYNLRANWGLSGFSVGKRFMASAVYELPFGKGKEFMSSVNGPVRAIVSGWSVAPIYTLQTGFPFTVTTPSNTANIEAGSLFPNVVASTSIANRSYHQWFNPAAFVNPAPYQWGNEGRHALVGPGTDSLDIALMKDTHVAERVALQFRGEFFNAFNHPNFGNPNASLGTGGFGSISSSGASREIQFGLKVLF